VCVCILVFQADAGEKVLGRGGMKWPGNYGNRALKIGVSLRALYSAQLSGQGFSKVGLDLRKKCLL
jgi:hypothetical protein